MLTKKQRQAIIIHIVTENMIETQGELIRLLRKAGVDAAQPTISRDLKELKIDKRVDENGLSYYSTGFYARPAEYSSIFAQSVISVDMARNIVVLKCHPGLAGAACKVVDEEKFGSVVGTIAGDDTVFIVTKTENHAEALMVQLRLMGGRAVP